MPSVQPNYLENLIPEAPPQTGESWQDVLQDVDRIIMPGLTHWHSPNFHAYYPTAQSYPAIVGEMLSAGFGCVGLSWVRTIFIFLITSFDFDFYQRKLLAKKNNRKSNKNTFISFMHNFELLFFKLKTRIENRRVDSPNMNHAILLII